MDACGRNENRMAELGLEKRRLRGRLDEINVEMRKLAPETDLPVTVEMEGHAVLVNKALYSGLPQVTVTRICSGS
jgi:hypothetical protein